MINIHALDGNDHFTGNIMMAIQFVLFQCVTRTYTQMPMLKRRFIEVAPKANYHPPMDHHHSNINININRNVMYFALLCFAFLFFFSYYSLYSTCLRVLLCLIFFMRPAIMLFVYTKICLKSGCLSKRKTNSSVPKKNKKKPDNIVHIKVMPHLFYPDFFPSFDIEKEK